MTANLLQRLERFSQNHKNTARENIFTELLAYLLETDKAFRSQFLRLIFPTGERLISGK